MVQVALLQGLTDAAADQVAAASCSVVPSDGTSKVQHWIKQQANSLAAQTSLPMVPNLPKSELTFLPDVMIRAAQQASPTINGGGGGGGGQTGGGSGGGGVGDGPSHGVLVQADQPEASGRERQCAPLAASTADTDQHLSSSNAFVSPQPVSWLEWEQQLQVSVLVQRPRHLLVCMFFWWHCMIGCSSTAQHQDVCIPPKSQYKALCTQPPEGWVMLQPVCTARISTT